MQPPSLQREPLGTSEITVPLQRRFPLDDFLNVVLRMDTPSILCLPFDYKRFLNPPRKSTGIGALVAASE